MSGAGYTVEVMHGINLDQLGRRDPLLYGTLRHGEAVGLGLLAALRLSGLSDLRGQVEALLAGAGLPTTLQGHHVDPEAVVAATRLDKKRTMTARTPFVLVRAPGDVVQGQDVADDDVALAVRELAVP